MQDPEQEFLRSVAQAMPAAARVRMQSRLVQDEWDAPVRMWQELGPAGGVGLFPRNSSRRCWSESVIPQSLRRDC